MHTVVHQVPDWWAAAERAWTAFQFHQSTISQSNLEQSSRRAFVTAVQQGPHTVSAACVDRRQSGTASSSAGLAGIAASGGSGAASSAYAPKVSTLSRLCHHFP